MVNSEDPSATSPQVFVIKVTCFKYHPVADPGFPREGGANPQGGGANLLFGQNERIWIRQCHQHKDVKYTKYGYVKRISNRFFYKRTLTANFVLSKIWCEFHSAVLPFQVLRLHCCSPDRQSVLQCIFTFLRSFI